VRNWTATCVTALALGLSVSLASELARPAMAEDVATSLADSVADELTLMGVKGSAYDPQKMHALGADGLNVLLDRLFPETAPKPAEALPDEAEIRRLIKQLGSDDYAGRESATTRLIAIGRPRREMLLGAAESDDAEVRLRSRRILSAWEVRGPSLIEASLSGFWKYAEGLNDAREHELLARRAVAVLEHDFPEGPKLHLTRLVIAGVAKGGNESACEILRPLIASQDRRIAKFVTETVGSYKSNDAFYPSLLVDALGSSDEEVVQTAIRWSESCRSVERAEEVRLALVKIFQSGSPALKFQATYPLTREFDDAEAWSYLIAQCRSPDPLRSAAAQARLADAKHSPRRLPAEVLDKVSPHFESDQLVERWGATKIVAIHDGPEVVERLIPLLGDEANSVADEAERGLAKQSRRDETREALATAAKSHANPAVRLRAAKVLDKLSQ
jgi:hypothetical protein